MLSRIIYAMREIIRHRKQLQQYLRDPKLQLATVVALTPADLTARGVKAVALDFDGVLAPHADPKPLPSVEQWLLNFAQEFGAHKIYILSNKPTSERQAYFAQVFPAIQFIVAQRKKPYPDGLQQILHVGNLLPQELLLVDDRLGTGILAAVITGVQAYWVTKPYMNFVHRPFAETFFASLRWLERTALC